jgi:hypothetical protein
MVIRGRTTSCGKTLFVLPAAQSEGTRTGMVRVCVRFDPRVGGKC